MFIHVPAAGIGGKTCLVQQGREQQTAIPLGLAASWGLLLQQASASRLGVLLLQPAAPEQQDVGNRESPGSGVMVGGGFERNGWALCWHLALLLTSGAVFSPHIHCKGCYKRMFPRPNRQMWGLQGCGHGPSAGGNPGPGFLLSSTASHKLIKLVSPFSCPAGRWPGDSGAAPRDQPGGSCAGHRSAPLLSLPAQKSETKGDCGATAREKSLHHGMERRLQPPP